MLTLPVPSPLLIAAPISLTITQALAGLQLIALEGGLGATRADGFGVQNVTKDDLRAPIRLSEGDTWTFTPASGQIGVAVLRAPGAGFSGRADELSRTLALSDQVAPGGGLAQHTTPPFIGADPTASDLALRLSSADGSRPVIGAVTLQTQAGRTANSITAELRQSRFLGDPYQTISGGVVASNTDNLVTLDFTPPLEFAPDSAWLIHLSGPGGALVPILVTSYPSFTTSDDTGAARPPDQGYAQLPLLIFEQVDANNTPLAPRSYPVADLYYGDRQRPAQVLGPLSGADFPQAAGDADVPAGGAAIVDAAGAARLVYKRADGTVLAASLT